MYLCIWIVDFFQTLIKSGVAVAFVILSNIPKHLVTVKRFTAIGGANSQSVGTVR